MNYNFDKYFKLYEPNCHSLTQTDSSHKDSEDIAVLCAKVFRRQELPKEPPLISDPPTRLQETKQNLTNNLLNKESICRVNLRKDFMKKRL